MAASKIKTILKSVRKYLPQKILNQIETNQSICFANQFTGFCSTQASTKWDIPRYKKRKLLVKLELFSEPHQKSRRCPFEKTVNHLNLVTYFAKSSILDARMGSEYDPDKNYV